MNKSNLEAGTMDCLLFLLEKLPKQSNCLRLFSFCCWSTVSALNCITLYWEVLSEDFKLCFIYIHLQRIVLDKKLSKNNLSFAFPHCKIPHMIKMMENKRYIFQSNHSSSDIRVCLSHFRLHLFVFAFVWAPSVKQTNCMCLKQSRLLSVFMRWFVDVVQPTLFPTN